MMEKIIILIKVCTFLNHIIMGLGLNHYDLGSMNPILSLFGESYVQAKLMLALVNSME